MPAEDQNDGESQNPIQCRVQSDRRGSLGEPTHRIGKIDREMTSNRSRNAAMRFVEDQREKERERRNCDERRMYSSTVVATRCGNVTGGLG